MRIAMLGVGTIGQAVLNGFESFDASLNIEVIGYLLRSGGRSGLPAEQWTELKSLIDARPRLVIECAGADAFETHVPNLLAAGIDVISVSMAAMARQHVEHAVQRALEQTGAGRLLFASGAVGALDALSAAREGGLSKVEVIQRKPPAALLPAEQASHLQHALVVKQSFAREVALALPQNSNVAAAVALAGLGFDDTLVTVVADPAVDKNTVEVIAEGRFGHLKLMIANSPSPNNPKTSITPAMSILAAVRRYTGRQVIPA